MKKIFGRRFFTLVVIIVIAAVATTQSTEAQELPCISELAGCVDFYNNTSLTPNEECCRPLANALKTEIPCICAIFSNPSLQKELGITLQMGLGLFDRCNITGASPNLCTSDAPASPPKNAPGMASPSPSGAAFRAEWTGFSTFFSLLFFIMA